MLHAQVTERDEQEAQQSMAVSPCDIESFLQSAKADTSSPSQRKTKRDHEFKVSDPIMPEASSEPPAKKAKTVSFTEELHTLIPCLSPDSLLDGPSTNEAMETLTAILAPISQPGLDELDKEQLIEADTVLRFPIPPVDDFVPIAPWTLEDRTQQAVTAGTFNKILKTAERWSGVSKLEQSMPWRPFPSYLGKIKAEGEFDDGSCARYLSEISYEGEVDFANLTWKPDGLRVFDVDEEEEEELEACTFSEYMLEPDQAPHTAPRAFQVRTMPMEDLLAQQSQALQPSFDNPKLVTPRPQAKLLPACGPTIDDLIKRRQEQMRKDDQEERTNSGSKYPGLPASATMSRIEGLATVAPRSRRQIDQSMPFEQFMALQGQTPGIVADPAATAQVGTPEASKNNLAPNPTPEPRVVVSLPKVDRHHISGTIITSSTLDRRIAASLFGQCKNLREILRESITSPTSTTSAVPETEAHITLSPSTGLMLTTLPKLKQKPLPGHEKQFQSFLSKVTMISHRYERLIILISEGREDSLAKSKASSEQAESSTTATDISPLLPHDTSALNSFISQTTTTIPNCEIQSIYILGGSSSLLHWIMANLHQYAPANINLQDEESFWEIFLRTAGLNAFAAQVVLNQLGKSAGERNEDGDGCESNLATFVTMSEEQRIRKFGALLGGENVLRRVSRNIDARWKSIAGAR